MTRRGFSVSPLAAAGPRGDLPEREWSKLRYVSDIPAGRAIPGTRVILNGREMPDCFAAEVYEDGSGVVWSYDRNAEGHFYSVDGKEAQKRVDTGRVSIIRPDYMTAESWEGLQARWTGRAQS